MKTLQYQIISYSKSPIHNVFSWFLYPHECNQQDGVGYSEGGALADLVPGRVQPALDEGGHAAAAQAEDGDDDAAFFEAGEAEERRQFGGHQGHHGPDSAWNGKWPFLPNMLDVLGRGRAWLSVHMPILKSVAPVWRKSAKTSECVDTRGTLAFCIQGMMVLPVSFGTYISIQPFLGCRAATSLQSPSMMSSSPLFPSPFLPSLRSFSLRPRFISAPHFTATFPLARYFALLKRISQPSSRSLLSLVKYTMSAKTEMQKNH